jgi:serralysin
MADINGTNRDDRLEGGNNADTISGFSGNDTLLGFGGDDTFFGRNGNDTIDGGGDIDTAAYFDSGDRGISANLATGRVVDAFGDLDTLISIERVVGTDLKDTLTGGNNDDGLSGRSGDDTLDGAGGNDLIFGGLGADTMTGGVGNDTFVYTSITHSPAQAGFRDIITDFKPSLDKIDVSAIDARTNVSGEQAFSFIGNQAFSAAGQARAVFSGGTLIQFETSGDGVADFEILLDDTVSLAGTDIIL